MDSSIPKSSDPFFEKANAFMDGRSQDRESWGLMIQRVYSDLGILLQREGQLVRAELGEKIVQVKVAFTSLVACGIVLLIAAQCLGATLIIMLSQVIPLWISAVLVTTSFFIAAGIMLSLALKKISAENLRPKKSIEAFDHIRFSLKEKIHEITKH